MSDILCVIFTQLVGTKAEVKERVYYIARGVSVTYICCSHMATK